MFALATAARPCLGLVRFGVRPAPVVLRCASSPSRPVPSEAVEPYALPKGQFRRALQLVAVKVPAASAHEAVLALQADLLDRHRVRRVVKDPSDGACRLVLLGEHVLWARAAEATAADEAAMPQLQGLTAASARALEAHRGTWALQRHPLTLGWVDCSVADVLRALLPTGVEVPAGFEAAGHVAHLNLRPEQLPHKQLIGAVVLDKNFPRVRSVVNKV